MTYTITEAKLRIAKLSKLTAPASSMPEDLSRAIDPDIRVSGDYPYYRLDLLLDNQPVSWCGVVDFQQQIGTACVRMGGIAGVGTHDDFRFRGYSRRVMLNALRWMCQQGFDATMLYGIAGYYPRFGYAEAFPDTQHIMAVRDAERVAHGRYRVVEFTAEYLEQLLAIFAANNAGRTGVTRRETPYWTHFPSGLHWGSQAQVKLLLDTRKRFAGYFVHDAGMENEILEVGYTSSTVFSEMLRVIAAHVWSTRAEEIHFHLPDDHTFIRYCRNFGLSTRQNYRRDGGAMVRLLNCASTLCKLAPLLATRVSGTGQLTIYTNLDSVGLAWSGSRFDIGAPFATGAHVRLPQWCLAQLLYGYLGADSPAFDGIITGTPNGRTLLTQLFPQHTHYHYLVDKF